MDLFKGFIEIFNGIDYEIIDNDKLFKIESKVTESIREFLSFSSLSTLKSYFNDFIKIYVGDISDEINLFVYLDDENELNKKISLLNYNDAIKVILDKSGYISSIFGNEHNILFFILDSSFEEVFTSNIDFEGNIKANKKNVFILTNKNYYFHNEFYLVTNIKRDNYKHEIENYLKNGTLLDIIHIINKRNELCMWVSGTQELSPDYLFINFDTPDFIFDLNIQKQIIKITADLIFPFLSNYTTSVNGKYLCTINGNKRIEFMILTDINSYNLDAYMNLYKMYKWIYENYSFDKINIFRNVLSILISAKRGEACPDNTYNIILSNAEWLKNSVEDNFQKFLAGNVNEYFKEKNNILQSIKENITNTNNQITEITKVLSSNLLSLIGIIIAGVVVYIAKGDVRVTKILGLLYIFLLDVNVIFSFPLAFIRVFQLKKEFNISKELYIRSYTTDKEISSASTSHKTNFIIFIIYVSLITVVIIGINERIFTFINDFQELKYFLRYWFKISI